MNGRIAKEKAFGVALAIGLVALLIVTACAPTPTEPVEKKVELGYVCGVTGAAAASVQVGIQAVEDYFRYFNEQEGLPGVSIRLMWRDDMLQYPLLYSHYERFVTHGVPLIFMEEATGLMGLEDRFEKDGVVIMAAQCGYEEVAYPPGWRYGSCPTQAEQAAVVIEYFRENWKEERPPRLAFVGIDSPFGYDPVATGTKYAEGLGFEVLPMEVVPFVTLDATTQLLRLKNSGVDLVYMQAFAGASGPILRDAERLGLLGQMHFSGHSTCVSEAVTEMVPIASEGVIVARYLPTIDEIEVPGIKLIADLQMKYHGEVERGLEEQYTLYWQVADVVCEAIKRAVENVGYENLDGRSLKEAMDSIKDYDVYGIARITYKPDDHRGNTQVAVYQVRERKVYRVTDWRESQMLVPEK